MQIRNVYQEDNVPPEVVAFDDVSLDAIVWGAQWLAYDISKLLTTEHLQFYADLATEELKKEEKSNLIYHFMKYYGDTGMDDISSYYEPCRQICSVFAEIFNNKLEERSKK